MLYELAYFGQINTEEILEYYQTSIMIGEREIDLDLNFEEASIEAIVLSQTKSFLESLESRIKSAKAYLNQLDPNDELLVDYFSIHEDLEETHGLKLESSTLILDRIGLYPSKEWLALFDFTFPKQLSDYMICIGMNHDGSLNDISLES